MVRNGAASSEETRKWGVMSHPPVNHRARGSGRGGVDGGHDAAWPQSLDAVAQLSKGGVLGVGDAIDGHVPLAPAAQPALLEGPA